jgi:hypothetical protein
VATSLIVVLANPHLPQVTRLRQAPQVPNMVVRPGN